MSQGHIEHLSGVLRIGGGYGEPYTWSATIRYLTPTKVEVLGAVRSPNLAERKAIAEVLKSHGIEEAVYFRKKDGKIKEYRLTR